MNRYASSFFFAFKLIEIIFFSGGRNRVKNLYDRIFTRYILS